jgi:hypothetical protein
MKTHLLLQVRFCARIQIVVYRTVGGNAALGPRIYEGAVTAVGGDWGSPNILPPASFHSATPLASAGGKGYGAHFKQSEKLKFVFFCRVSGRHKNCHLFGNVHERRYVCLQNKNFENFGKSLLDKGENKG